MFVIFEHMHDRTRTARQCELAGWESGWMNRLTRMQADTRWKDEWKDERPNGSKYMLSSFEYEAKRRAHNNNRQICMKWDKQNIISRWAIFGV